MIVVETADATLDRLRHGATVVLTNPAIFRIEGPGAVTCLQGLLTNDIETPGPGSLAYGALLTPKGMIVLDLWVLRDTEGFTLVAPAAARGTALELFRRSLPPRLARLTDRTGEWAAAWLIGDDCAGPMVRAGLGELPPAGTVASLEHAGARLQIAGGTPTAWFRGVLLGASDAVASASRALIAVGAVALEQDTLEAARVMAGWPALGAEIGEKTLPQEVGYDELGGVSYTKGCYTGQETVARVHFRGHPNRELRGLIWNDLGEPIDELVTAEGKEIGRFTSVVVTATRRFGLAVLRREVQPGAIVVAGGRPAVVVGLPFGPELIDSKSGS